MKALHRCSFSFAMLSNNAEWPGFPQLPAFHTAAQPA